MKISEDNLGKFDTRVDEGIFLEYSTKRKAYKSYNKRLRKVIECIDARIGEKIPNSPKT